MLPASRSTPMVSRTMAGVGRFIGGKLASAFSMSVWGLTSGLAGAPPAPAEILRHASSVMTTSRGV